MSAARKRSVQTPDLRPGDVLTEHYYFEKVTRTERVSANIYKVHVLRQVRPNAPARDSWFFAGVNAFHMVAFVPSLPLGGVS